MDDLADDLDIESLRQAGWNDKEIRIWVIGEVRSYNKTANPHKIKVKDLNDYLDKNGMDGLNEHDDNIV